nr:aspartate carbamoyltransferase regulatory subunit [Anaerotalea alkaliphila]
MNINGIKRGIVIDHIKPGLGFKIFRELKLDEVDYTTALIKNAPSDKLGTKDLIKIDNEIDLDLDVLGLIDPDLTICIIENEQVVKKIKLALPKAVTGILQCKNPRCITSVEPHVETTFLLVDAATKAYKCEYCNSRTSL